MSLQRVARRLDPILVVGVSISSGLAVLLFFVTNEQAVLALIVGLVGTMITLQVELVSRVKQDARLTRAVERVPWLSPLVTDIADAAAAVRSSDRLNRFEGVAQGRLEDCHMYLEDLRHGHVRVVAGDFQFSFEQMEQARERILATSVGPISLTWWDTQIGRSYWELNCKAVKRGVCVERIFIYDRDTPELREVVERQHSAGMNVYLVQIDEVPHDLRIDCIVWDDACTMEVKLSADAVETDYIYSVNEADIRTRLDKIRRIKMVARPFDGSWERLPVFRAYDGGWHGPVSRQGATEPGPD